MNAVKMYLYRMLHTKSSLVIIYVVIGFAIFTSYMVSLDAKYYENHPEEAEEFRIGFDTDDDSTVEFGINVTPPMATEDYQPSFVDYLAEDLNSGILLVFVTIFVVLFVNGEENSGYIKNIAGGTKRRGLLVESKAVAICLYQLVLLLVYMLATFIAYKLFLPDVKPGWSRKATVFIGMIYLLMVAFGMFIHCITILCRSNAIGIVVGLLDSCGIGAIFTSYINNLIDNDKFDINRYMVLGRINTIGIGDSSTVNLKSIVIAFVWFAIWLAVSEVIINKRDIRGGM